MKSWYLTAFCFLLILFTQCKDDHSLAFEQASGIAIPPQATQQEYFDDGKFVKTSAFKIDSEVLKNFVQQHKFEEFTSINIPQFWGIVNLKEKPDLENLSNVYYKNGLSGNLSWIYIADLKSSYLWTEIKYPGKPAY